MFYLQVGRVKIAHVLPLIVIAMTFTALTLIVPQMVAAQDVEDTANAAGQPLTFNSILKKVADRDHVAIIAEGYPQQELPVEGVPVLSDNASPDADVQKIASSYDYDVAPQRGGVYVLKKRYSNLVDLPNITPAECLQASEAIQPYIAPYAPTADPFETLSEDFPATLPAAQWKLMEAKALPLRSLNTKQQEMLKSAALGGYIDSFTAHVPDSAVSWMKRASENLSFCWGDLEMPADAREDAAQHDLAVPAASIRHLFGLEAFNEKKRKRCILPH